MSTDLMFQIDIQHSEGKCGIKERETYNKPKNDDLKQFICPIEKEEAIKARSGIFR